MKELKYLTVLVTVRFSDNLKIKMMNLFHKLMHLNLQQMQYLILVNVL